MTGFLFLSSQVNLQPTLNYPPLYLFNHSKIVTLEIFIYYDVFSVERGCKINEKNIQYPI